MLIIFLLYAQILLDEDDAFLEIAELLVLAARGHQHRLPPSLGRLALQDVVQSIPEQFLIVYRDFLIQLSKSLKHLSLSSTAFGLERLDELGDIPEDLALEVGQLHGQRFYLFGRLPAVGEESQRVGLQF